MNEMVDGRVGETEKERQGDEDSLPFLNLSAHIKQRYSSHPLAHSLRTGGSEFSCERESSKP